MNTFLNQSYGSQQSIVNFKHKIKSIYQVQSDFKVSNVANKSRPLPRRSLLAITLLFIIIAIYFSLDDEAITPIETKIELAQQDKIKEPLNQDYLQDNLYSKVNSNFSNEQVTINGSSLKNNNNDTQSISAVNSSLSSTKKLTDDIKPKIITKNSLSEVDKNLKTRHLIIKNGDSLAIIFQRLKLSPSILYKLANTTKDGKQLKAINIGQQLDFVVNSKNFLQQLVFHKDKVESIHFNYDPKKDTYSSSILTKDIEKRQRLVNVTIKDSLFHSATEQGLSDNLTMRIAQLFAWDIDFALDVREGDSFSVLFNEHYLEGEKINNGDILAAEFINQGSPYYAIYYNEDNDYKGYYDQDGYSKRKAFLKTPVAFTRISSKFSKRRLHPVFNRVRAHKGVDYAAPRGTPVKAVGDGKVVFKGRKGGYGKVLQIQHGSKYMTVYAHLNAFNKNVKRNGRVSQGQTIAYVGSTGTATGPHLHYEFRVNGVHRNPLTVKLPRANPLAKRYLPEFKNLSQQLLASLKRGKQTQLALSNQSK